MRTEKQRVLVLDPDEQQLMVRSLYDLRNSQIRCDGPTEDVDDLLLKVIDAPRKRFRRQEYEAR